MDEPSARYPVTSWLTGTLVTLALAVAIRLVAALVDVEVLVPERDGGPPVPLELGPIVVVILAAFAAAILAVLVLDRVARGRSRRILRAVGLVVLVASLVPVYLAELPTDATVTLTLLHLVVAAGVLRTVVRE